MLQIILKKCSDFYRKKNRWWIPLIAGVPFIASLPPFNHEYNRAFALFPLLNFAAIVPLMFFSVQPARGRAILHTYLFSYSTALVQCFWLVFVKIEGLWALIVFGMVLLAAVVALFFLAAGMMFRWCYRTFPKGYLILFPSCWVLIDYIRTLGEISFPWGFLGYNLTHFLPIAQVASLTGVWGMTWLIAVGNLLIWELGVRFYRGDRRRGAVFMLCLFIFLMGMIAVWGRQRMATTSNKTSPDSVKVALLQTSIDQLNWSKYSLEEAFDVTDSMVFAAAKTNPDIIIGPESALLCYLSRQNNYRKRVCRWVDSTGIPIILGAIHWDKAPEKSIYDYLVYNTAFLIKPHEENLLPYRKIKLVPFSESIPLEGIFPILSRVNLGEADFKPGKENTVYEIGDSIRTAPMICYEIIYPDFVRRRLKNSVNLIIHITNDGWFGKTTGPYQHATMARMRSIENGVSLARCAITGVSLLTDPFGRKLGETRLWKRTILQGKLPLTRVSTLYSRFGDWFVVVCLTIAIGFIIRLRIAKTKKNSKNKKAS